MSKCTEGVIYKVKMVEGCRLEEGGGVKGGKGQDIKCIGGKTKPEIPPILQF